MSRDGTLVLVAGTPRSGSTLLLNLLAQCPEHYVPPVSTSGLMLELDAMQARWQGNVGFQQWGFEAVEPRARAAMGGYIRAFYGPELAAGKVVFDKQRMWPDRLELLEAVLGRRVRVVCPIRDMRAVLASFERQYRSAPVSRRRTVFGQDPSARTTDGRARILASAGGTAGIAVNVLRDAISRGLQDRLIWMPYRLLTTQPRAALAYLHTALGRPLFQYDPENVEQHTREDDVGWGWGAGLHKIRRRVEPPAEAPWHGVLDPRTCHWIVKDFQDINGMAQAQPRTAPSPPAPASPPSDNSPPSRGLPQVEGRPAEA